MTTKLEVQENTEKPSSSSIAKKESPETKKPTTPTASIDYISYILLIIIIAITIFGHPHHSCHRKVSMHRVCYNGWITAVATGFGVIPFYFFKEPNKFWMGISNAVAGGMMIAASYSLICEGLEFSYDDYGYLSVIPQLDSVLNSLIRTTFGVLFGISFILITKKVLAQFGDIEVFDLDFSKADTQKMILIIVVMTLHSLTEGVGIGVSFGGSHGHKLGRFITFSLAAHNIPEGLAVGLVLTSRNVSTLRAALWAIFTSLPQPIFAVPAYLFVERFAVLLPGGLGFAAGAMGYVAIFELFPEAIEDSSMIATAITGTISCLIMTYFQIVLKQSM